MIRLTEAETSTDWLRARQLVETYAASLPLDLGFQDFATEISRLPLEYGRPQGAFLLAFDGERVLGCGALREFAAGVGEIKRLYVVPEARGRGIGRQLATRLVGIACEIGYSRLLLDTLPSMSAAQSLYRGLGFVNTVAYRFNPDPGAVFMELRLK